MAVGLVDKYYNTIQILCIKSGIVNKICEFSTKFLSDFDFFWCNESVKVVFQNTSHIT